MIKKRKRIHGHLEKWNAAILIFKMPARGFRNISPPITLPLIAECFTYWRRAWALPWCLRPVGQENRSRIAEGSVFRSFSYVNQAGIFSLFRNSDRLAGTFCWSRDPSTAWLVPSTAEDPACWKQVSSGRQLKIQRKNPGSALLMRIGVAAMSHMHNGM